MNSKTKIFTAIIFALLGCLVIKMINGLSPILTFLLGMVVASFIFYKNNASVAHKAQRSSNLSSNQASQSTQTLYVGNLPYKANESNVRQLFSEYGQVHTVRLMKDKRTGKRRGFGFVVVDKDDAQNVIDALNEHEYMQRLLKVRIANDPKHPEEAVSE